MVREMSVTSVQCSSPHSAIKNCAHKQIYNFGLNLIYFHVCFLLDNRNSSHTDTIIRSYRNWMISKSNYTEILIYFLSAQAKNSDISVFLSLSLSLSTTTNKMKKKKKWQIDPQHPIRVKMNSGGRECTGSIHLLQYLHCRRIKS